MARGVFARQRWWDSTQDVLRSRVGAIGEQEPACLEIGQLGQLVQ